MASSDHALLSASGAHRWLNCTPLARLESDEPESTSAAAKQGTTAHALAEHKLRRVLKQRSKRPVSAWIDDEMERATGIETARKGLCDTRQTACFPVRSCGKVVAVASSSI